MKAINNDAVVGGLCGDCGCEGFIPTVNYSINAGTSTITFTQASTIPAGDALVAVIVHVNDGKGNQKDGKFTTAGGNAALVCTGFDFTTLHLTATVVTQNCKADVGSHNVFVTATTGTLGSVNDQGEIGEVE